MSIRKFEEIEGKSRRIGRYHNFLHMDVIY